MEDIVSREVCYYTGNEPCSEEEKGVSKETGN